MEELGEAHQSSSKLYRYGFGYETSFMPQYHLLKLCEEDIPRLYLPISFVDRCSLKNGVEVALIDCLGRTQVAVVESCASVHYLGRGWKQFLDMIEGVKGDTLLFKFCSARTCKVILFSGGVGSQKYPVIEEQYRHFVLHPREPRCFFSSDWPHVDYPSRALNAGPCTMVSSTSTSASPVVANYIAVCDGNVCNATGDPIVEVMMQFVQQLVDDSNLQMPLYYCKLGFFELESGFLSLDKGFSVRHISSLMDGCYSKPISIRRSTDAPVNARLFLDFQGGAHISDGWLNFVRQQGALNINECVLQFSKIDNTITVVARLVCSSSSD